METKEKASKKKHPSEYGPRFILQPPRIKNKAEMIRLADEWYDTRDQKIRDRLIIGSRGVVGAIQSEFSPKPPLQRRDLIGEGFIGIIYAVDHYEKGGNFVNYAFESVRTSIINCFRNSNQIKIGGGIYRDARDFSEEEIEKIFTSSKVARECRLNAKKAISAQFEQLELTLHDVKTESPTSPVFEDTEKMDLALEAIASLDSRSKRIIEGRFLEGKTLKAIGKEFCLCKETIRRNESEALQKIRSYIEKHKSANYSR